MDKAQQDALKKAAGIEAAKLIQNGINPQVWAPARPCVSWSTSSVVASRRKASSSRASPPPAAPRSRPKATASEIVNIDDVDHIDVTIDGADEVDKNFNGIKGGGAALLWEEEIVATNSNKIVRIVDESKVVDTIGKFPLPVEVIPFGAGQGVVKKFEAKGYKPVLRLDANGEPVRTDENNYVVDLHLERIDHPQELAQDLITTVGVVEHGLFLNMVDQVIVGDPNGRA